jgi:hypothetical protein
MGVDDDDGGEEVCVGVEVTPLEWTDFPFAILDVKKSSRPRKRQEI